MKKGILLLASVVCVTGSCGGPAYDENACTEFVTVSRMGLGWERLNHRVSRLGLGLEPGPGEACIADTLKADFVGGDFSTGEVMTDAPRVAFGFQKVRVPAPSTAGAGRFEVEASVGPPGETAGRLTIDRGSAHLAGYPCATAFVEGIRLTTDVDQPPDYPADYDPAHGYTSRGIGAKVAVSGMSPARIDVDWSIRFAHGTSDRDDMNEAITHAVTGAALDLLVVGHGCGEARGGFVEYVVESPASTPLQDVPCNHAAEGDTSVTVEGPPGPFSGFYGLTGFEFHLDPDEPGAGYYLRDLEVSLDLKAHDPATGTAKFSLEGYASNASGFIAFYPMSNRFEGSMAWVAVDAEVSPGSVEETFETGVARFPLE